jgi:hypothetical protein
VAPVGAAARISAWVDERAAPRFLVLSAIAWYLAHTLIWGVAMVTTHTTVAEVLNQSDSTYYSDIVQSGFMGRNFAFFPLFPALVRVTWFAVGRSLPPQFIGAAISTACVAAFVWLTARWADRPELTGLVPKTRFAWLTFLLWPASYVVRTHHTEGLFLLLSFVAFARARQGRWIEAALLAGFAALCRNQGVFVALVVAFEVARRSPQSATRFLTAGIVSFIVFSMLPIYDFTTSGDALAFYHAQRDWTQAHSAGQLVRVMWLGNPWQRKALGGIVHNAAWIGCLLVAGRMRASAAIQAVYTLLSLGIIIFQGELVMTFRFVAVLFPFLYFLGDWVTARGERARIPFALLLLLLNLQTTWKYATGGHAY